MIAPLAVVSAVLLLAWWGLHLALALDALARDRQFEQSQVRRCGLDREWYAGGYREWCGP